MWPQYFDEIDLNFYKTIEMNSFVISNSSVFLHSAYVQHADPECLSHHNLRWYVNFDYKKFDISI